MRVLHQAEERERRAARAERRGLASPPAMHGRAFSGKLLPPPFPQLSEDVGLSDLGKDAASSAMLRKFNEH